MTALLLTDKKFMCTVYQENFRIYERLYSYNRYELTNETLEIEFNIPVIVDIVNTRYKICKLNRSIGLIELSINPNTRESSNGKTEWLCKEEGVYDLLAIGSCYIVVDSSFFSDKLELISVC